MKCGRWSPLWRELEAVSMSPKESDIQGSLAPPSAATSTPSTPLLLVPSLLGLPPSRNTLASFPSMVYAFLSLYIHPPRLPFLDDSLSLIRIKFKC